MYLTPQDFSDIFGSAEALALSDRENIGIINFDILTSALQKASAEVDSYLATRYHLPLQNPPKILMNITADIARYRLTGGDLSESSPIFIRYIQALNWLKDLVAGRATLPDQLTPHEPGQVQISSGSRPWQKINL